MTTTLKAYELTQNSTGRSFGYATGQSPVDVLAKVHRFCGFPCTVHGQAIVFENDLNIDHKGVDVCGQVADWTIREIGEV